MEACFAQFKEMKGISPIEGVTVKSVHLDKLMTTWMEFTEGAELPEHSHPHEQITIVVEGIIELTVEGTSRVLEKGGVAVVPSGVIHSARIIEGPAVAIDGWSPVREDYIMPGKGSS
ncbi:MAG: cupin domain-containing protein [Spirochaetota bacterium]